MKTKLTLSIDKELLKRYKEFCNKNGIVISAQAENLMKKQMKEGLKW